ALTKSIFALDSERNQGNDIIAQLEQFSLPDDAFTYLVRVRNLLASDAPLLDSEWNDIFSILVQVEKRRAFAAWRQKEQATGLLLGPDHFQIPEPPPAEFPPKEVSPLPTWRATWIERQDWQDNLQSRIDQQQATITAQQEAISLTEESDLPLLR